MKIIIKYLFTLAILFMVLGCEYQNPSKCFKVDPTVASDSFEIYRNYRYERLPGLFELIGHSYVTFINNRFQPNKRKLVFYILNNPYGMDNLSHFYVFLKDTLVVADYFNKDGQFHSKHEAYIPTKYFNCYHMPTLIFECGDAYYNYDSDIIFYLDINDKYIYLFFNPDIHKKSDIGFFSTKEDIFDTTSM